MKKLLSLIFLSSVNIFATPSKSLLDDAIRQNDVQLAYDILQSNTFTIKEKRIYYELAHDMTFIRMQEKIIASFKVHPLAAICLLTGLGFSAGSVLFTGLALTEQERGFKKITGGIAAFNAFIAFLAFRKMIKIGQWPEIDYQNSLAIKQIILSIDETE